MADVTPTNAAADLNVDQQVDGALETDVAATETLTGEKVDHKPNFTSLISSAGGFRCFGSAVWR